MKVVYGFVLLITLFFGVAGTVYFYMLSNDLSEQMEQMKKQHIVELYAVKDTPYPSTDYYIEQLDKLTKENEQLKHELEQQSK